MLYVRRRKPLAVTSSEMFGSGANELIHKRIDSGKSSIGESGSLTGGLIMSGKEGSLGCLIESGKEGSLGGLIDSGKDGILGGLIDSGKDGILGGLIESGREGILGGLIESGRDGSFGGLSESGSAGSHPPDCVAFTTKGRIAKQSKEPTTFIFSKRVVYRF